jgi:hypothetical protein
MHHVAEGKIESKQVIELVPAFNICKNNPFWGLCGFFVIADYDIILEDF